MTEIEQPESGESRQKEQKADLAAVQRERLESLGGKLSRERVRKGFTLADISEQLRIREVYLESLEKGEWSDLPEEAYVRGFLRQYAELLDIDISEELDALKSGEYHLTKPFTMPDPSIAPSRKWTIAVSVVFILFIILINVLRDTGDHREPIVPQTPPPSVEKSVDQPASPAAETAVPEEQPSQSSPPSSSAESSTTVETPLASTVAAQRLRFTAVGGDAWMQLFDDEHQLLKEALLKPGDSLTLTYDKPLLFVTCGNAAALEIHAGDALMAAAGSLGEPGKVLRDYKLVLPDSSQ